MKNKANRISDTMSGLELESCLEALIQSNQSAEALQKELDELFTKRIEETVKLMKELSVTRLALWNEDYAESFSDEEDCIEYSEKDEEIFGELIPDREFYLCLPEDEDHHLNIVGVEIDGSDLLYWYQGEYDNGRNSVKYITEHRAIAGLFDCIVYSVKFNLAHNVPRDRWGVVHMSGLDPYWWIEDSEEENRTEEERRRAEDIADKLQAEKKKMEEMSKRLSSEQMSYLEELLWYARKAAVDGPGIGYPPEVACGREHTRIFARNGLNDGVLKLMNSLGITRIGLWDASFNPEEVAYSQDDREIFSNVIPDQRFYIAVTNENGQTCAVIAAEVTDGELEFICLPEGEGACFIISMADMDPNALYRVLQAMFYAIETDLLHDIPFNKWGVIHNSKVNPYNCERI